MPITSDGTVIPSYLEFTTEERFPSYQQSDYALLTGEVKNIIYPDEENSRSKRLIEYDVFVQYRHHGASTGKIYNNCVLMNSLGSLADSSTFVLRANKKAGEDTDNKNLGYGSKVLILCVNGDSVAPVIIGGLPDPKDEIQKDIDKDKKFLSWVFNGIRAEINDDGELQVTYEGATNEKAETDVEDSVAGSFVKFDKDGNIFIQDSDGKNLLEIDHKNGNVIIQRDKKLKIGQANEAFILGTSYRKEEKTMHNKMIGVLNSLQQIISQMATQINIIGVKHLIPVYGPVTAAAEVSTVGTLAQASSQLIGQLKDAVQTFENNGQSVNDYKSEKNFGDK